jgi:hypothetical protein
MSSGPPPPIPIGNPLLIPSTGPIILSPTSAIFFWDPPVYTEPITHYQFSIDSLMSVVLPSTDISYQVDGLQPGVPVTPTIRSSSDNGVTWGDFASFPLYTPLNLPSSPPTSPSASVESPGVVTVSWGPPDVIPDGPWYYLVQSKSSDPNDPTIGCGTQDSTLTSCTISNLNIQSQYTFLVNTINPVGRSPEAETNSIHF